MARFELTISNGEKILIDHPADDIQALLAELSASAFLVAVEIKVGATSAPHDVILATRQITLARPADADSRQSSTFRPKR
jgi:hypothetical protein